ncbi:MAG TPA: DUF3775 domain-containing protein [Acidocella sp.]|nr:DUF3775 domain-containing protein [Acidocella sp.]
MIAKARQFDAKDVLTDPDSASNPSDDGMRKVLEAHRDDPVYAELTNMIWDLNEDEQIDLVTLAWLGRNNGESGEWDELRAEAAQAHNDRTGEYLLGMPLLGDYLEAAIAAFGLSCDDIE